MVKIQLLDQTNWVYSPTLPPLPPLAVWPWEGNLSIPQFLVCKTGGTNCANSRWHSIMGGFSPLKKQIRWHHKVIEIVSATKALYNCSLLRLLCAAPCPCLQGTRCGCGWWICILRASVTTQGAQSGKGAFLGSLWSGSSRVVCTLQTTYVYVCSMCGKPGP